MLYYCIVILSNFNKIVSNKKILMIYTKICYILVSDTGRKLALTLWVSLKDHKLGKTEHLNLAIVISTFPVYSPFLFFFPKL